MAFRLADNELDAKIITLLSFHIGKRRAIGRWEMVFELFGVNVPEIERNDSNLLDRDIRDAVSRLRGQGHLICDLGDGNGRYLAENEREFWELYEYYMKPVRRRLTIAQAMKRAAEQKFPNMLQPALFSFPE